MIAADGKKEKFKPPIRKVYYALSNPSLPQKQSRLNYGLQRLDMRGLKK
jgi:hypothetical protein